MSGPFGSSQWMYASGAEAESQALRFNDGDSAYLSWTPSTAGTLTKCTFSAWVKRGNLSSSISDIKAIVGTNNGGSSFRDVLRFTDDNGTDVLSFQHRALSSYTLYTPAVFRDPSAWYHIVLAIDTTQATEADRVNIYVNGEAQTLSGTYPPQNNNTQFGRDCAQYIGARSIDGSTIVDFFDGYMSEVNFVDGTALDPTSFGETDANGQWVPIKEPSVTYGTNGFYLPFTNDYEVEGFNTVTYTGNGGTQYVGGVGFEPDFLWIKRREGAENHILQDSVRGAAKQLFTNTTEAELSGANNVQSFETDGFVVGTDSGSNGSGRSFVAWAWDAGTGSAASNTDGSITSTVKASQTYGQSVVTWTGTGTTVQETIGVGLNWSGKNKLVITKNRDSSTYNWGVNSSVLAANKVLSLNTTNNDSQENSSHYITYETDGFRTYNGGAGILNQSGQEYIAYCFHSVAGYSDIGSYTGNGSTSGPTITTGFKPAFVMIKRTDSTGDWHILDNTRSPYGEVDNYLYANTSAAEYAGNNDGILITDTTFQLSNSYAALNASGGTYIYIAFADKREAAFWLDQSGNNNDWTNNNMQESDISLDSPTNNFATMNPLASSSTLSEGNLRSQYSGSGNYKTAASTMSISSGKWYVELRTTIDSSYVFYPGFGIADITTTAASNPTSTDYLGNTNNGIAYYTNNGFFVNNVIDQSSTVTVSSGDILGIAIDLDSSQNTFKIYQNGTLAETYNINAPANAYAFCESTYFLATAARADWNFGQDSSFHGLEVAQGNQDANGKGDFYYEPPAGYLALCTDNLPDPAIADGSEHFNTVLYTGNGSTNAITGVGFQPDFVWTKPRSFSDFHQAFDLVRGTGKNLSINQAVAEQTQSGSLSSFDSDGFTIGSWSNLNSSGSSFVAWNWKADNTSGSSNTDGTITSTVSANTTAGFSIVGYTGDGNSSATIGHGLNAAPEMMLFKGRTFTSNWTVYHVGMGNDGGMQLNQTAAEAVNSQYWNNTTPTSSVFTIGLYENTSSEDFICYAFHSVEGYSKFGSYTGNGSADGPFIYTGFRPAFVMVKASSTASNWFIWDVQRNTYNAATTPLFPNSSSAEEATLYPIDVLSNGFKLRASSGYGTNESAAYIYMAFAENPFKYSNAR